jgi:acetolactate synthase-1/2/3 large subunit
VGGFATAAKDGSPVIHVTAANLPRGGQAHGTHTVIDQELWMRSFETPVIDFAHAKPGDLSRALERGRAATVVIPVTKDGTGMAVNWSYQPPSTAGLSRAELEATLARWAGSKRRLLWIGGGCRAVGAGRLVRFAEATGCAVVTSTQAKDLFPAAHPQYVGCGWTARARGVVGAADACLALGTRFTEITTRAWAAPFPQTLVRIGWTHETAGFAGIEETYIATDVADALDACEALVAAEQAPAFGRDSGDAVRARRAEIERDRVEYKMLDAIDGVLEPGDVLVADMTISSFWAASELDLKPGVRFVWPGLLQIGYGVPAGIGAALARPESNVLVLTGDGSIITTLTELDAGVAAGARLTVLLVDDDGYGMLRPHLGEPLGQTFATFGGPKWSSLAAAFGVDYVDVGNDLDGLRDTLSRRPDALRLVRVDGTGISKDFLAI